MRGSAITASGRGPAVSDYLCGSVAALFPRWRCARGLDALRRGLVAAGLALGMIATACRPAEERPGAERAATAVTPDTRPETATVPAQQRPDTRDRTSAPAAGLPPRAELERWAFGLSASPEGDPVLCGLSRPTPPDDGRNRVTVYFGCQGTNGPVQNAVPARTVAVPTGTSPMRVAVRALLGGPTSEEVRAGYLSGFGAATADIGFAARDYGEGLVVVNFDSSMPPQVLSSNIGVAQVGHQIG